MDSPSDETLLLAVAERDMGAFRTLYERHAGWLAIRLARRCNDRDLVADAIGDTFVAVWQKPQGFRGDGDIAAWLWGIAVRRLVSRLRSHSRVAAVFEHTEVAPAAEDQVLLSVEYGDIGQVLALLSCEPCRARVNAAASVTELSVIDLAAVWDRTRDAVEVPRPSLFERLLRGAGLPAHEARLVAVASAFRGVWLVGVVTVLAFAALAAAVGHARGVWLFLAVAPVVPCLVVASSYDPWMDPALEPELATPYPALRLILLRTIAVLALALPAVLLFGLVVPGQTAFAWLLPAVGFVAVVLAASTWVSPLRSAIAVGFVWLAVVWLLAARSGSPDAVLQARAQAGFLALAAASFSVFVVRRRRLRQLRPWR